MGQLQVIKDVGPKLIPFIKALTIYFVVFIPEKNPGYIAAAIKCLPIICLMIFVVWYGQEMNEKYKSFWKKIFFGLFFSCIGDYCLVWPETFVHGMVAFGIGHVNYISAFGMKPLKLSTAIVPYSILFFGLLYLWPGLTGIMLPGVPIYAVFLTTMVWRAASRVYIDKAPWSWSRLLTAISSLSFVISDFTICLGIFKHIELPNAQVIIMVTYYFAQFGLSMSVLDAGAFDFAKKKQEDVKKCVERKLD